MARSLSFTTKDLNKALRPAQSLRPNHYRELVPKSPTAINVNQVKELFAPAVRKNIATRPGYKK